MVAIAVITINSICIVTRVAAFYLQCIVTFLLTTMFTRRILDNEHILTSSKQITNFY